MDVYGLTGGIGAGKTAVAELLQEYGIPVVSADELSRMVVAKGSEGLAQVVEAFGDAILDPHGELDRRAMARVVFADPDKRRRLEEILHPLIRERYETVLDAIEKSGHPSAVYEVPLLFEKNLQGDMTAVILVTASDVTRVRRVRVRDGATEHDVRARMAAQMDEDEKRRRADYVLFNEGSLDDLRREVELLLSRFMKVAPRFGKQRDDDGAVAGPAPVNVPADAPSAPLLLDGAAPPRLESRTPMPSPPPASRTVTAPPAPRSPEASAPSPVAEDPTPTKPRKTQMGMPAPKRDGAAPPPSPPAPAAPPPPPVGGPPSVPPPPPTGPKNNK